jgi:hypothetical protein
MTYRHSSKPVTFFENLTGDQQGWTIACFITAIVMSILGGIGIGIVIESFGAFFLTIASVAPFLMIAGYQVGIKKLPETPDKEES